MFYIRHVRIDVTVSERKDQHEFTAHAFLAFDEYIALIDARQFAGDGQPESRSLLFDRRPVELEEFFEYFFLKFIRYSYSRIGDFNHDFVRPQLGFKCNRSVGFVEFDRVIDKPVDDIGDLVDVQGQLGKIGRKIRDQRKSLRRNGLLEAGKHMRKYEIRLDRLFGIIVLFFRLSARNSDRKKKIF